MKLADSNKLFITLSDFKEPNQEDPYQTVLIKAPVTKISNEAT